MRTYVWRGGEAVAVAEHHRRMCCDCEVAQKARVRRAPNAWDISYIRTHKSTTG